ncbi:MAG: HAMP domain-containing protein [Clostridiales bacterium]|nr:HAMP domain-containing protein [Clostridiales bacterium]
MIYCFSRFATDTSVLIQDGETLYTRTTLDPAQILPLRIGDEQKVFLGEVEGRNILLVGRMVSVNDSVYSVYRVEDITYIYNNIRQMIVRFILIGIAGVLIGTLLILSLVYRLTRPLFKLKEASARIAQGEYDIRADIHTQDEVGELAQDFNAMADAVKTHIDKLTDMNERQSLFISGLTHEYKTPMTSILLHSETLLTADLDKKSMENSLAHIHDQCRFPSPSQ